MFFLSSADFFSKSTFLKNSFSNTIRVSNSMDPDQDRYSVGPELGSNCLLDPDQGRHSVGRHSVGPDLGANCLQRFSADSADFFFRNQLFFKILSVLASEYHTVWIQIRTDILLVLIWVQTVCKGYQQKTLVGKEGRLFACWVFICLLLIFFKYKKSFRDIINVSNTLGPDQAQTVCNGYQQKTLARKESICRVSTEIKKHNSMIFP